MDHLNIDIDLENYKKILKKKKKKKVFNKKMVQIMENIN